MKHNLSVIFTFAIFAFFTLGILTATQALAGQGQVFFGCFKDLPGWSSEPPMDSSFSMGQMKMVNVVKNYTKGDKYLTVMVTAGTVGQGQGWVPAAQAEAEVNTAEGSLSITHMNGYPVHIVHDKKENTVSISIALQGGGSSGNPGAMLIFTGEKLSKGELIDLAKSFDWDCFKSKVSDVK